MTNPAPTTPAQAAICRASDQPFVLEAGDAGRAARRRSAGARHGLRHLPHRHGGARRQLPTPLPAILGHEGAGIVEAVGADESHVKPGDRVIMSFNSCGHCAACDLDKPTYCYNFVLENWLGTRADGSATAFQGRNGGERQFLRPVFLRHPCHRPCPQCRQGAGQCRPHPLATLAPLGCGFMTGAGAVLRSMAVRKGAPIAIFGAGAVGLAAVMAAKIAGADPIIAVDVFDSRLALAKELGALTASTARARTPSPRSARSARAALPMPSTRQALPA